MQSWTVWLPRKRKVRRGSASLYLFIILYSTATESPSCSLSKIINLIACTGSYFNGSTLERLSTSIRCLQRSTLHISYCCRPFAKQFLDDSQIKDQLNKLVLSFAICTRSYLNSQFGNCLMSLWLAYSTSLQLRRSLVG